MGIGSRTYGMDEETYRSKLEVAKNMLRKEGDIREKKGDHPDAHQYAINQLLASNYDFMEDDEEIKAIIEAYWKTVKDIMNEAEIGNIRIPYFGEFTFSPFKLFYKCLDESKDLYKGKLTKEESYKRMFEFYSFHRLILNPLVHGWRSIIGIKPREFYETKELSGIDLVKKRQDLLRERHEARKKRYFEKHGRELEMKFQL